LKHSSGATRREKEDVRAVIAVQVH
jgi:hypothetical protein